jgi:hypothetical protein
MFGSLIVAILIVAVVILAVTLKFGSTSSAELETLEDVAKEQSEAIEERARAAEERREDR